MIKANNVSQRYVPTSWGWVRKCQTRSFPDDGEERSVEGREEAVDMMRDIMKGIARERRVLTEEEVGGDGGCYGGGNGEFKAVCETITSRAIGVQFIKL